MRFEFVGIMKDFPLREPLLCAKLIASNPCNDRGRARTHPARQRDFVIDCDPKRRQRTFPLRCHTLGHAQVRLSEVVGIDAASTPRTTISYLGHSPPRRACEAAPRA